jgi:hypothetical protein
LIITNKGEEALKPANLASWEFIQKVLSPLSSGDKETLLSLLLTVQYEACKHLNSGFHVEETSKNKDKCHDHLMEGLNLHTLPSAPEAGRQSSKKGKTRR